MMANWREWLSIGYGPNEWHRDRHAGFVVLIGYVAVLAAAPGDLTWDKAGRYAVAAGCAFVLGCCKSYLTNNKPPEGK